MLKLSQQTLLSGIYEQDTQVIFHDDEENEQRVPPKLQGVVA